MNQLIGVADVPSTFIGNDTFELHKAGVSSKHSLGFVPVQKQKAKGGPTTLTEIYLFEGGRQLWGVKPNAPMLSVGKSVSRYTGMRAVFQELMESLHSLEGMRKCKKFTEDYLGLFDMRVEEFKQQIKTT